MSSSSKDAGRTTKALAIKKCHMANGTKKIAKITSVEMNADRIRRTEKKAYTTQKVKERDATA